LQFALALLVIAGGAAEHTRRLERAAERQIRSELGGAGEVRVQIKPQWGALGVLLAKADAIHVYASGFQTAQMPFFTETPVTAWQGHARRVHIKLEDFRLRGVPVRRLEATLPNVALDSRAAAFALRIRLFRTGWGDGRVTLDETCLTEFIARRLPEVHSVQVNLAASGVTITGEIAALLGSWRFTASGQVAVREGQQVVIENASLHMEGEELPQAVVQKVMDALNPVLDIERDLRLGSAFVVERVEQGDGSISLIGRATIPPRQTGGLNGSRKP